MRVTISAIVTFCMIASTVHAAIPTATLTTLASLNVTTGYEPYSELILDNSGNLLGTAARGGANVGTIFRIPTIGGSVSVLYNFTQASGNFPAGALLRDSQGRLIGTTVDGGAVNNGTVFRFDPSNSILTTLGTFNTGNGSKPGSRVVADSAGNLYSTTYKGGASNNGTVFKIDTGGTLSTIANLNIAQGSLSEAGLLLGPGGFLFGTTATGGGGSAGNKGTIFRIDPATNAFTTLAVFNGSNGSIPLGDLVADASGNLFGTTYDGVVYKFNTNTNALTTIASFNASNPVNESHLYCPLIIDANGHLYGTTSSGGDNNLGTVFDIDPATGSITTLATFNGANGSESRAGLVADQFGNLYGTTRYGGTGNRGTVFKITGSGYTVVPEPSCISVALVGALVLGCRRRA